MAHSVTRHFVSVGRRQVHYRRAGAGAPVLLLHQSPKNSADLLPLIAMLAPMATVIAPDTPGYGLSDPLPGLPAHPDLALFADATAALLDALEIPQVAVYGFHTGAAIALKLAARHPQRVTALCTNGLLVLPPEERTDIVAHYLPRFEPDWDGSHLAWLWARLRDQSVFFPWYRRSQDARMAIPLPEPAVTHAHVMDFLAAGDNYRHAYAAALGHDPLPEVASVTVTALHVCAMGDPLAAGLEAVTAVAPDTASTRLAETPRTALAAARDFLLHHLPRSSAQPPPAVRLRARGITGDFATLRGTRIRMRRTMGAGRPVLLIHDAGASSAALEPLLRGLAGRRPALAPDLPGHGDSGDPLAGGDRSPAALADACRDLLESLGIGGCDVVGIGAGAAVGLELARLAPRRVAAVHTIGLTALTGAEVAAWRALPIPDFMPDAWGGHLHRAWHFARQQALWWPWFATGPDGMALVTPRLDGATVHAQVLDLLRSDGAHAATALAAAEWPTMERLAEAPLATKLWLDPCAASSNRAATIADAAGEPIETLPADPEGWADAIFGTQG